MAMEGDLALGGGHTMQYTYEAAQNCTLETYIILLTNVNPVSLIKLTKNKKPPQIRGRKRSEGTQA